MATLTPISLEANEEVRRYLQTVTAARRLMRSERQSWPYLCVEDFVLRHGQAFTVRVSRPEGMWPGAPRCCFQNAAILATTCPERYTYVEGYAVGMFPVHHAWVMDAAGRVLDITWPEPGSAEVIAYEADFPPAYFGVAFQTAYVKRVVMGGIGCCLDNFQEKWPLLSGAHSVNAALQGRR